MTEICRVIQEDRSIFWELTVIGYCKRQKNSHERGSNIKDYEDDGV
jgi:hypothetical protein